jgi:hypothetical protein
VLGKHGAVTPLDKAAAHDADYAGVRAKLLTEGGNVIFVTVVEGVIFADYTGNVHFEKTSVIS